LIESLSVRDGPVNQFRIDVVADKDSLDWARLFFRPGDVARGSLLQQTEDLSGNINHVLVHMHSLLTFFRSGNCYFAQHMPTACGRVIQELNTLNQSKL
jgi:hypothetical protein